MIFGVIIFVLLMLLALLYKLLRKHSCYWQDLGVPSDEPKMILRNLLQIGQKHSFMEMFQEYYNKYKTTGPFAGFYWFLKPAVFVMDPELIKLILIKDFSKFSDRGMFVNEEDDPLTAHLFNLEGCKWKNMRHKISPTFTSGKMKAMFSMVIKICHEFVDVFEQSVDKGAIVEVKDLMTRFTTDIIGSCAFGLDMSSLQDPNNKFRIMGKRAFVEKKYGKFGMAFRFGFPKLAKKLHMKDTVQDVEDFFLTIARDTVCYREQNSVRRNDFMDMLIDLKNNKQMKTETHQELTNITFKEIAAQAFVFLVAGFETSSTTMGFVLYELAQHEVLQQRARDEISKVLNSHNQEFTYDCIKELLYLDQIMAETLRIYTILPMLNRFALEDYTVPGHPKYVIKKDMPVLIPAAAIHRDARYYPNPDVFNPDNFSSDKVAERDSVLFLAYGDGPRNCIGMRFAKMQTLVGLAMLLKHFKFSVCEDTQIPLRYEKNNFLCCSEGGINLSVTRL